ncbi:MAG: DUF945 family protein [Woeseiaceae bacterium]|nr:DUF945 family protein [Woeseiaceae bacterium]
MKKSIVVLIVVLALVVLVSPGIIGMFADRAVEQQVEWAEDENTDLVIQTERFDRGWFSSEGTHRISIADQMRSVVTGEALPDLVVETRIDHGIVPLASLGREQGTLKPGLGSAISTMRLEFEDGSSTEVPGTIYTDIGLVGDMRSRYELEAGGYEDIEWSDSSLRVTTNPQQQTAVFEGEIPTLSISDAGEQQQLENLRFAGDVKMTPYGFATGEFDVSIGSLTTTTPSMPPMVIGPVTLSQASAIENERLDASVRMNIDMAGLPGVGDAGFVMDFNLGNADAAAFGELLTQLDEVSASADPDSLMLAAEDSLMDLCAGGFELRFNQLDLTLPAGVLSTRLDLTVPETNRADFTWTSLLLAAELNANVSVPTAIYYMASMMNPDLAQAVEMGILKQEGDAYEMVAEYKKGLLSVNGAPFPLPIGATQ